MTILQRAKLICCAICLCVGISDLHAQAQQKHICIIGSSSAFGYFGNPALYPKDSGWVKKLFKYYKDAGVVDTICNIAQSTTDCFTGMPSSYHPPAGMGYNNPNPLTNITRAINMVPRPDVIIVNYPTNNYDWIPNWQIINCLQTIKDSANAANIPCYITTSQPRDPFSPSERQKLKDLRNLIMATFGIYAIDFFTDVVQEPDLLIKPQFAFGDGVHLNPAGHSLLANRVIAKNLFSVVLAVNITELKARYDKDKVLLNWQTLEEHDNATFIVEKSTDGIHFSAIGDMQGSLNSTVARRYDFTDDDPIPGNNYYRLVAVTTSGQKTFSATCPVHIGKINDLVTHVYPSVTTGLVLLTSEKTKERSAIIKIYSGTGNLLQQETVSINSNLRQELLLNKLAAGVYIISIQTGSRKNVHKIVKQ